MRRDTLVFAVAGVLFGFVLGYMAAEWQAPSRSTPVAESGAATAPTGRATSTVDPNEERALVDLAQRDPANAGVRVELGTLYMEGERWDDAIRWYREALDLDPELTSVSIDLGACLIQAGRPEEGLAAFDGVLAREEGNKTALYNKGIALVQLGRPHEAVEVWEEVLERYPDDPQLTGLRSQLDRIRRQDGGAS